LFVFALSFSPWFRVEGNNLEAGFSHNDDVSSKRKRRTDCVSEIDVWQERRSPCNKISFIKRRAIQKEKKTGNSFVCKVYMQSCEMPQRIKAQEKFVCCLESITKS